MSTAPPILCKHPMLKTIEVLANNDGALLNMIQGIIAGGKPEHRLDRIDKEGLFAGYGEGEKQKARERLLKKWGDEATLEHISDQLGEALQMVRRSEPKKVLRTWWAAGATTEGIRCAVQCDAKAVYFVLLTPPLDQDVVADKLTFDNEFLGQLKLQANDFKDWTDGY